MAHLLKSINSHNIIGVANPGPIISSLWADDDAESTLVLDGVVTVVDSVNILNYLSNPGDDE
jgi:G3E family GTPase